jgi:hypothetical protein
MFTSIIMGTPLIEIGRIRMRGPKVSLETIHNKDLKDNTDVL